MSSFDVIETTLASDVADDATFTVGYPSGKNAGHYTGGTDHRVNSMGYGELRANNGGISVSFGTSNITITNKSGTTMVAGTKVYVQLDIMGRDDGQSSIADPETMVPMDLMVINLGAPDTADVDGIFEAYTGSDPALDGALVSGDVATLDVPRNIVVDSGGADTAVLTFTGTDAYGETVVESITLNGTTAVAGKKAFKTITGVSSSGAIANGAFAGPGDVLGLPMMMPQIGQLIAELEDGSAASAGTLVAGVQTAPATATTGDVRGTYDPNSACNGAKSFQLVVAVPDPSDKGVAQYAG